MAVVTVLMALTAAAAAATHGPADKAGTAAGITIVTAVASAAGLLVVLGLPSLQRLRTFPLQGWILAGVSGAASAVAPYILSTYRYSDAPAGSVVVFVTTSLWGLATVLLLTGVDALRSRDLRALPPSAGALLAAVAGAGILANWERPSSFSPIVRFGLEQGAMLLAGVLWIVALLVAAEVARRYGIRVTAFALAAGNLLLAAALLPFADLASMQTEVVLPYGLSAGATTVLAFWLLARGRGLLAGLALTAGPALISVLTIVERYVGVRGPRPLLVGSVLAASGLLALGAASILGDRRPAGDVVRSGPWRLAAEGVAAAAAAASLIAMLAPALRVTVNGLLASGDAFDATFSMRGFETLGAWLALAAAALLFAATASGTVSSAIVRAVAAVAAAAASVTPLGGTPLHTWVSWLPPEVQQDYGTEYASIAFERLPYPLLCVVVVLSVVGALLLARLLLLSRRAKVPEDGAGTEVRT